MQRSIIAIVVAMLVSATAYGDSFDPKSKIGTQLLKQLMTEGGAEGGIYDILVYVDEEADLEAAKALKSKKAKNAFVYDALRTKAHQTQGPIIDILKRQGVDYRSYYITNMVAAFGVSEEQIYELAKSAKVRRLLGNPEVKILTELADSPNEEFFGVGPNITQTGAAQFWEEMGTKGAGIVVANQDTGIDWDHPGLKNQYRGWDGTTANHNYNWHDAIRTGSNRTCGVASREPCDDHGHGTHTLGTSVGDDGRGNQVGMAPESDWIACRNMDAGNGRPSTYIECFEFFLAPWPYGGDPQTDGNPELAAHVINNSWGCPRSEGCEGDEFLPVLEALNAAGIMVVAAAGNSGSSCGSIADGPAHHSDLVFSVGAVDHRSGNIASFSSRGPSRFDNGVGPDLSAPGVSVRSTTKGGGYAGGGWSGTSMASPHVAGAVALLWSADEALVGDIAATSELLRGTAEGKTTSQSCAGRSGQQIPNNTYGHGLMNVYEAGKRRGL